MTRIVVSDFRACGVCPKAKGWFERHGLDWRAFVRDGIDVEVLRATGDQLSLIDRLEAVALKREAGRGR